MGYINHSWAHRQPETAATIVALAWQWYLGGILDRLSIWPHRIPLVSGWFYRFWCETWERKRGIWSPIRGKFVAIPWELLAITEESADLITETPHP
jgi:hypothetical protein